MVFLEKIVSFLKQLIIVSFFGTTSFTDAYQMAENIVSVFRGSFSSSFPVVFLTNIVYNKQKNNNIAEFSTNVVGLLSIFVIIITLALCLFLKFAVNVNSFNSTLSLFIFILSPTIILGFLSCMLGAMLEAERIYWPSKVSSFLTSICVIAAVLLLFTSLDIISIFIGEIFALILHILLMVVLLSRNGIQFAKKLPVFDADIKNIFISALPLMVSSSIYSINTLVDKMIAVTIEEGAATVLQYAKLLSLDLFPVIIVTAFSGLMVREFSEMAITDDKASIDEKVCIFLEAMFGFLGVITIVSLFFYKDLITIAFMRGEFNADSARLTESAFIGYIIGVPFFPFREVTARVFYGFNDTRTPFFTSVAGVAGNIVFSIIFAHFFGLIGITVASTLSIIITVLLNFIVFYRYMGIKFQGFVIEVMKLFVPFVIACFCCFIFNKITFPHRLFNLLLSGIVSGTLYFFFLKIGKCRALKLYISLSKKH